MVFTSANLLRHFEKYIDYYNRFLAARDDNDLYLELMQDGFIFIYKDLEIFYKRVTPFTSQDQATMKAYKFSKDPFLMKLFIPRENFPKDGLRIHYSFVLGDPEKIYNRSVDYFKTISPRIQIIPSSPTDGDLFFPDYESILDYLKITSCKYLIPR